MRATESREEIDEGLGRGMGSRGGGREYGWTGENMRDEGFQQGLDRKCVSINILYLGLADHTLALGDNETQYRSHVQWWMSPRLQCQPTQRSPPTGTNHLATAPPSTCRLIQLMEPSTAFDWLDALWIDFCCLVLEIYPLGIAVFVNHALCINNL